MGHLSVKSKFVTTGLCGALLLFAAACGGPPAQEDSAALDREKTEAVPNVSLIDEGEPEYGDWLIESVNAEPPMISPFLDATDGRGRYISNYIFDSLLASDNETMQPKPHLAERWEATEDHLSYTFYLRKDVVFSDGTPLTAQDVTFSYDLIMAPTSDSAALKGYFVDITSCEAVDDYTVRFTSTKPYFKHLEMIGGISILPKHIYSKGDINKHPGNKEAALGSGPYVLESWDTGQQITLARNNRYWGKKPYLDKRVFKIIIDDSAKLQTLLKGELGMMEFPSPELWYRNATTPEFEARFNKFTPDAPVSGYLGRYGYIGWNMRKPQFNDKHVRRALTMLLDRQSILDQLYYGEGQITGSAADPKTPEFNKNITPFPFDPPGAIALLEKAGWRDTDGDGIRDKEGEKLAFDLMFGTGSAEYDQMTTVYQEELKAAGIAMTPRPMDWGAMIEKIEARTFDACMLAWLIPVNQDPYQLWHSSGIESGSNYPGFKNAEVDTLLEEARVEFDRDKRIVKYHRVQEIIHEEQPYTFIFNRRGLVAVDKRFHGVKNYPAGFDPLEFWVPKADQRYH